MKSMYQRTEKTPVSHRRTPGRLSAAVPSRRGRTDETYRRGRGRHLRGPGALVPAHPAGGGGVEGRGGGARRGEDLLREARVPLPRGGGVLRPSGRRFRRPARPRGLRAGQDAPRRRTCLALVRDIHASGKLVAFICHAGLGADLGGHPEGATRHEHGGHPRRHGERRRRSGWTRRSSWTGTW